MPIVDADGRLFGRWNLVDALAALFAVGLVPLAYGAWVLFRAPAPVLTAIEPAEVTAGPSVRVMVKGRNLRPYLRVSFGTHQGENFLFSDEGRAEVDLGGLGPGTYDVVLYDFAQERSRLPGALTVKPTPLPASEVELVGTLGNLAPGEVEAVQPGLALPGIGRVVGVGQPVPDLMRVFAAGGTVDVASGGASRVPVTVRAPCQVRTPSGQPYCYSGDVQMQPTFVLITTLPSGERPFQIDQVRSTVPLQTVRVTALVSGLPDALGQLRPGLVDLGREMNELAAGARVVAVAPHAPGQVVVTLEAQAQESSAGLLYAAAPLRTGAPIAFRTRWFDVQGTVNRVERVAAGEQPGR